jgi:peptidoglycan/LPS O-acetylase OafA/YrhL
VQHFASPPASKANFPSAPLLASGQDTSTTTYPHVMNNHTAHRWPTRYHMLDAWRGIAAMMVVIYHLDGPPLGHLGVMIFFVISGYCIAAAAESGRERSMSIKTFMWRRVRRIYPPYCFAVSYFVATRLLKYHLSGDTRIFDFSAIQWVQNYTLTQWLTLVVHPSDASPFANPTLFVTAFWTLNYEEQFYAAMAACLAICYAVGIRPLYSVLLLLAFSVAWKAALPSLYHGFFLEYWIHFALGALIYYYLCRLGPSRWRLAIPALVGSVAILFGVLWLFDFTAGTPYALFSEEMFYAGTFGVILIALRPCDQWFCTTWCWSLLRPIGLASYSLYLVHEFQLRFVESVVTRIMPSWTPSILMMAAELALHIAMASVFWYFCERPFLNRPYKAGAPQTGASATPATPSENPSS